VLKLLFLSLGCLADDEKDGSNNVWKIRFIAAAPAAVVLSLIGVVYIGIKGTVLG